MYNIYIRFHTGRSVFNLQRFLACTKKLEGLILDLLFADNCTILVLTEEALQMNMFILYSVKVSVSTELAQSYVCYQALFFLPQVVRTNVFLNTLFTPVDF